MATIVHFEIPADDVERAKNFYSELFNWEIEKVPGPMDYWLINTTDEKGQKGVGGGMMARQHPQHQITNYIDVPSVDDYVEKIKNLGGEICVAKSAVPGMGYFAVCLDTENNAFAIWEEDANAK